MCDARAAAVKIVQVLQAEGHVAYLAGGCVRDRLLGKTPKDYDVATDAPPSAVRALFHRSKHVGEAFGVVLVQLMRRRIEVATFRTEWGYEDGRRPTNVTFSDAEHDAQRRDFTINGLFEDPVTNRVIDFVGGQGDLKAGVVRAIGEPDARFAEDYLRLLPAVRFGASLEFTIERRTAAAVRKYAARLTAISRERIGQEVQAMLTGPQPATAGELLQRLGLDGPALNEDHRQCTLTTLRNLGAADYPTALAAWVVDRYLLEVIKPDPTRRAQLAADFAKTQLPEVVRRWRRALCLSNEERDELRACLNNLPKALDWLDLNVARRKRLLADPSWPGTWALIKAIRAAGMSALRRTIARDIKPLLAGDLAPPPLLGGDDLIDAGLEPGPNFAQWLRHVYDAQLEGIVNTREEAMDWIRRQL